VTWAAACFKFKPVVGQGFEAAASVDAKAAEKPYVLENKSGEIHLAAS
jgi:hypothetical protein